MTKAKKIELEMHKMCLLSSGKCVSSALKCLHRTNLILTFMFPVKSLWFHKRFHKFRQNISFCATDLDVLIQITTKPNL